MSHLKQNYGSKSPAEQQVHNIVIDALVNVYKSLNPKIEVYLQGYVKNFQDNLLTSVRIEDFIDNILSGAGNELESKFPAIYSSAALVINSFAPFRSQIGGLSFPPPLLSNKKFHNLEFEKKFYTGLKGTPPHVDVLLNWEGSKIVAIESKFTEILHKKSNTKITATYFDDAPRVWKGSIYHDELIRIRDGLANYQYLDATQLIKHTFGLMNTYLKNPEFQEQKVTLLYLYWEPENIDPLTGPLKEVYNIHADELIKFKTVTSSASMPTFESMSYSKLWNHWERTVPNKLKSHVIELKKRYLVTI